MRYWEYDADGFVMCVGTGRGGIEITKERYDNVMTCISNKPKDTKTIYYMLSTNLEWIFAIPYDEE